MSCTDMTEICPVCHGNGFIREAASHMHWVMFGDEAVQECRECGGHGAVEVEPEGEAA